MTSFEIVHQPLYASNKKFFALIRIFLSITIATTATSATYATCATNFVTTAPGESTQVPLHQPSKHSQPQQKPIHYLRTKISTTDMSQNLRERCLIFTMHNRRATNNK